MMTSVLAGSWAASSTSRGGSIPCGRISNELLPLASPVSRFNELGDKLSLRLASSVLSPTVFSFFRGTLSLESVFSWLALSFDKDSLRVPLCNFFFTSSARKNCPHIHPQPGATTEDDVSKMSSSACVLFFFLLLSPPASCLPPCGDRATSVSRPAKSTSTFVGLCVVVIEDSFVDCFPRTISSASFFSSCFISTSGCWTSLSSVNHRRADTGWPLGESGRANRRSSVVTGIPSIDSKSGRRYKT